MGEAKEIVPARYGYKAVIRHLPDQAFALDGQLYRRLGRRFDTKLALWASADDVHMVTIATFRVSKAAIPTIAEMSLMPVTAQRLPVEESFERQLVERLVAEGRAFIKGLRYGLTRAQPIATATSTDTGDAGQMLFMLPNGIECRRYGDGDDYSRAEWAWHPSSEAMPSLPERSER